MSETMSHLVQNLSALVGLLAVTIVFAAMGDSSHAGEALAAFVGYAAGSRTASRPLAALAPIVAAGVAAVMLSGCTGTQAIAILKPTCAAIRVLGETCNMIDSGGETP